MKQISEMAYTRTEIRINCTKLGIEFIQHFDKICSDFLNGDTKDFKHHSQEMQAWWDQVRNLIHKSNKKKVTDEQLYDWFFTAGSLPEIYLHNDKIEIDAYETLVKFLLQNRDKKVNDVLNSIFHIR